MCWATGRGAPADAGIAGGNLATSYSAFAKADPRPTLTRVDQVYARLFEGALNDLQGGPPGHGVSPLKQSNCLHPNPGLIGQLLLGPGQKRAGGTALCGREHATPDTRFCCFSPYRAEFVIRRSR